LVIFVHTFAAMKTYRIYLKCFVDVEANSVEEAEDVVQEMDYNFSHNGDDFRSEILEIEEIKQKKIDTAAQNH